MVFGEQPSASKWNILGTNDAAFNSGGGVLSEGLTTTIGFYATTAQSYTDGSAADVTTYTEVVDYGSDFVHTTGLFTCPVAGFYQFNVVMGFSNPTAAGKMDSSLLRGAAEVAHGLGYANSVTYEPMANISIALSCAASDVFKVNVSNNTGGTETLYASSFSGFLIGTT